MKRKTIEVTEEDHKWLMETRGSESVKKRVSKVTVSALKSEDGLTG